MTTPRTRSRTPREPKPPPDAEQAFEIAGRFLGTRPRSRWEVEQRLRRSGTTDEVVAVTLERLERIGFVDDTAFARWWVEQRDRHSPRGRMALETELRAKRIPPAVIAALRDVPPDEEPVSEDDRADAALERHLKGRPLPDDPKALQRLGMYLVRRGFDPATARAALRRRGAGV
ncbi:MAG TPA: regulatory protein RecX [Candidatus Limnocylindria bacterium]|nr:regulatory protein RecX [Candidatus Limnocylindria bacterium]